MNPDVQAIFGSYWARHSRPIKTGSAQTAREKAREMLKAENYPLIDTPFDPEELKRAYARRMNPEPVAKVTAEEEEQLDA